MSTTGTPSSGPDSWTCMVRRSVSTREERIAGAYPDNVRRLTGRGEPMSSVNGSGEGHGASVKRVEDPPFLRGARPYTDDLRNAEALYAVFVRSGLAHAKITGIDTSFAKDAPGVVGVY